MSSALAIPTPIRLVLLAPARAPALAADLLASHLGIPPELAHRRLARLSGPLAEGLSAEDARRLCNLLCCLGLQVRLEADAPQAPALAGFDVALQVVPHLASFRLANRLAAILARAPDQVLQDLGQPGGVILRGLELAGIEGLRRALRRLKDVQMAVCHPEQAVFDLFARRSGRLSAALLRHLSTLGLQPCLFNGALASGLDRRTLDHVITRFGDSVFGLERAFQRLDLYLCGSGAMTPLDLADFLATRTATGSRQDPLSPAAPLRIETGLSHTAARQFQIDYDMIGLQTFARLSNPGR